MQTASPIWLLGGRHAKLSPMPDSPVDLLLEEMRAKLQAARAPLLARTDGIREALASYRAAVEAHIAHEFAVQHGLKRPELGPLSAKRAAERLYTLVAALPELEPKSLAAVADLGAPEAAPLLAGRGVQTRGGAPSPKTRDTYLARLLEHSADRKLVVIGARAGRSQRGVLPPLLEERTEWIDTERDGVHAIGNLPQRIRQGRVAGIVILELAVQHKHTEPVVAAARDSGTLVAFAGKGGRASLQRAFEQLDERLCQVKSAAP